MILLPRGSTRTDTRLPYTTLVRSADRQAKAIAFLGMLPADRVVLPVQVLGELFRVLTRKAGRSDDEARLAVQSWRGAATIRATSAAALLSAMDSAGERRVGEVCCRTCRDRGSPYH